MGLYCSKQLETTFHQFCEKQLHITFKLYESWRLVFRKLHKKVTYVYLNRTLGCHKMLKIYIYLLII